MKHFRAKDMAITQAESNLRRRGESQAVLFDDTYELYFCLPYDRALNVEFQTYDMIYVAE